jgi:hypothetical protein
MENFFEMRDSLFASMKQLKSSIDEAMYNMTEMYGQNHYAIVRLRSYYPALDKQLEYAVELDRMMSQGDYDAAMALIAKIQGISEMIRSDAKSILNSLNTGKEILPDTNAIN